ncbi:MULTISPECIES: hypothetical protein [Ponticoccus]|uniref:Homeodomain-like domain-containing protein n=1 Tax=Ponticoccus litoralis TaxID=422297 RepID=A0AAW9SJJ5_9RHOB
MSDENSPGLEERDLFGNPILPLRDRRGRPSFAKTPENQDFVAVRAAANWSHKAIAEAIGCDEKTLRKHFSRELHGGALILEGLCLDVLMRKVREGHTPSIRALQDRLDRTAPPAPQTPKGDEANEGTPRGKKEQRLADAAKPAAGYGELYDRIRGKGRAQ